MRSYLLIAIVLVVCSAGVFRAKLGLYGYVWFAMMRPDVLAWAEGRFPYSLMLAIATAIGSVRWVMDLGSILRNPICRMLLALVFIFGLSAVLAVDPSLAMEPFGFFLRVVLMSLLIPLLIRSEDELRTLLIITGASLGLLGVKFGIYGLLAGGARFSSGYGGMISDNNDLALALIMASALCWHVRYLLSSPILRVLLLGIVGTSTAAVVMTYSRGGALTLSVMMILIAFRSRHTIMALTSFVVVGALVVNLVGTSYIARLSTVTNPTEEGSARHRMENYWAAFEMWEDYPLLGVGFGNTNQQRLMPNYIDRNSETSSVMHSTYLQVLVDSGFFGIVTYISVLFGTIAWLEISYRRTRVWLPGKEAYPAAIQTSLIAFVVGGAFLSRVAFDLVYILLMIAAAWWAIERDLFTSLEQETDFAVSSREA